MSFGEWRDDLDEAKGGGAVLGYGVWCGECRGPYPAMTTCVIRWDGGHTDYPGYDWQVVHADMYAEWFKPTHWMPLPSAPKG